MEKIVIDFKNILSELEGKILKICFIKNKPSLFIEDNQNNLYQMELYRQGSYLDKLIKDGTIVEFNVVDTLISQNIGEWEKEIWDVSAVKSFMIRQHLLTA
jgi:hypothetical protein